MQYPEGALCLEQVKQLLIATHERRVVIYAFNYDSEKKKVLISPVQLYTNSKIDDRGNLQGVKWLSPRDEGLSFLASRPRCLPFNRRTKDDRGWVFGNYWLAYGYGLRLQHEKTHETTT